MKLAVAMLIAAAGLIGAGFPAPAVDLPAAPGDHKEVAVLAGGCFWGVDAVFKHVKGVREVVSGYAGGAKSTAHYEMVGTGRTGHAESVQITYDPALVTYGKLLEIFFSVAHDPTELNRQGPDEGTQYRSAIFYSSEDQKRVAEAYIAQLDEAHVFKHKIVTQLTPLTAFYAAEPYHQNYLALNPGNPYIVYNDLPKLDRLKKQFPDLYKR
jgi:peptide-methionine (S)-S-oxide reductase